MLTDISVWSIQGDEEHDGAQIDLLIDRQDRVINLCEIKFSDREFVIEKEYDRNLRNKIGTFIDGTGCRKSIMLTMITPYGVKRGKYSSLVTNQVVLDDLFVET